MSADPTDIGALENSVNGAAGKASALWTTFITFELYLSIAFGSVTHQDILFETPIKLPILNVDLPLIAFFAVAPTVLVIFHFYVFLQLIGLANKASDYNYLLRQQVKMESSRQYFRHRLDSFLVLQFLAGHKDQRTRFQGFSLRFIAWITLVAAPILILLQAQLVFLPYHHPWVTWYERLLLVPNLAVIWFAWSRVRSEDAPILGRRMTRLWRGIGNALSVGVLLFSTTAATYPGEWIHENMPGIKIIPWADKLDWAALWAQNWSEFWNLDSQKDWYSLHELLFTGAPNEVTGEPSSIFSSNLVLTNVSLVGQDKLEKADIALSLRGRDLRSAVLSRADLRKTDFSGATLQDARLDGAKLQSARFACVKSDCTLLTRAVFVGAQLQGADFSGARLQGADFSNAQIQGAKLVDAQLQGADLSEAKLQGANMFLANMRGAYLFRTVLQGASLASVDLGATIFVGAELQGASFEIRLGGSMYGLRDMPAYSDGMMIVDAEFWRAAGDVSSGSVIIRAPSCRRKPWDRTQRVFNFSELNFSKWLRQSVDFILNDERRSEALDQLTILDPKRSRTVPSLWDWDEHRCIPDRAPDSKVFIEKIAEIACDKDGSPFVAQKIISNIDHYLENKYSNLLLDRLWASRTDMDACPGTAELRQGDWEQLARLRDKIGRSQEPSGSAPVDLPQKSRH